jgi:LysR family glycine cleavage system transcriptional activator
LRRSYVPSLSELQAFVEASRTGSATLAGAALGLTQSAVSRSIGGLEARLGVQLFHRSRGRLALSDAGRAFLRDAEGLLAGLDRAALTVMSFGGRRDVLRIATLPSFGAAWLAPRLARFAEVAPEITFDVTSTLDTVDFDSDGRDAAIQRAGAPLRGALSEVLAEERLVVVAAPAILAGGEMVADAELGRMPLLQQATRPELWLDFFRDAGLDPITILRGPRFEQFGMVIAAARAGMGLALVPEVLAADDLQAGRLRLASSRSLVSRTPYLLTYPERSLNLAAFRRFRDWLLAGAG